MPFTYRSDLDASETHLGDASMVFHCHFYNCQLQEAVERGMGNRAAPMLVDAARDVVAPQLRSLVEGGDAAATLTQAEQLFGELGFGQLSLAGLTADGGSALCPHSHYAMGWVATRGQRDTPCCHFVTGFIAGALAVAHGIPEDAVTVRETGCFAMGAERCRFDVEVQR